MPAAPQPSARANVGEIFVRQLTALADYALAQAGLPDAGTPNWYRPDGFTGDLATMTGLSEQLSRREQVQDFISATTDKTKPGTVGDLHLVQLQGDALAMLERAFRARHLSTCRSRIQPLGRLRGHGHEFGVIRGLLQTAYDVDRNNKGEPQ